MPFATGYGMEIAMTIDRRREQVRASSSSPVDLTHRPTGRTLRGFAHRARQLADFAVVYARRR